MCALPGTGVRFLLPRGAQSGLHSRGSSPGAGGESEPSRGVGDPQGKSLRALGSRVTKSAFGLRDGSSCSRTQSSSARRCGNVKGEGARGLLLSGPQLPCSRPSSPQCGFIQEFVTRGGPLSAACCPRAFCLPLLRFSLKPQSEELEGNSCEVNGKLKLCGRDGRDRHFVTWERGWCPPEAGAHPLTECLERVYDSLLNPEFRRKIR